MTTFPAARPVPPSAAARLRAAGTVGDLLRRHRPGGRVARSQEAPARGPGELARPRAIARHSALEFLLTFVLLFGVVTFVRWVIGPSAVSRAIPHIHLQLVIVGAAVGLLVAGLILSPPGRASGAHLNPAISLAMWRFGVFPGAGLLPYAAAQLAGSALGVLAAGAVWGSAATRPPVSYAVLQPAASWGAGQLFAAEALSMFVIVLIIGVCLSVRRLAGAVPWIVGLLVGGAIALLGTLSGGSDNPARQFGPAVASGQARFLWAYLLAPMLAATLAAAARRVISPARPVMTHRLSGLQSGSATRCNQGGQAAAARRNLRP